MKKALWFLLGIATSAGGFYLLTLGPRFVQPTTPTNLAILVKQAIDVHDLYAVKNLMIPQQRNNFSNSSRDDILHLSRELPNFTIVAVHMNAWNHCHLTRENLRDFLTELDLSQRVLIPENGDVMTFPLA